MRNLQEQVKKAFYYQKLFWPFTVSASNFKSFSRSLEHFFLTVGQHNFGNKIPFFLFLFLFFFNSYYLFLFFFEWSKISCFSYRNFDGISMELRSKEFCGYVLLPRKKQIFFSRWGFIRIPNEFHSLKNRWRWNFSTIPFRKAADYFANCLWINEHQIIDKKCVL